MTKKQRAQVVELLRCAADLAANGDRASALGTAAFHLGVITLPFLESHFGRDCHWVMMLRGRGPVWDSADRKWQICGPGYEFCLLEAAQRVEEGSWP
jgi:hypothetical protein